MPRVQFVQQAAGINVTKSMVTPKRVSELRYWMRGAQAVINEMPQQIAESEISAQRGLGQDGWFVARTDVDPKWIRFDLENKFGEKAQVVIDRKFQSLGGR